MSSIKIAYLWKRVIFDPFHAIFDLGWAWMTLTPSFLKSWCQKLNFDIWLSYFESILKLYLNDNFWLFEWPLTAKLPKNIVNFFLEYWFQSHNASFGRIWELSFDLTRGRQKCTSWLLGVKFEKSSYFLVNSKSTQKTDLENILNILFQQLFEKIDFTKRTLTMSHINSDLNILNSKKSYISRMSVQ